VREIINCYTREAGVRELERQIAAFAESCQKAGILKSEDGQNYCSLYRKVFGNEKYRYDMANEKDEVGVATGLAWTPVAEIRCPLR